MSRLWNAFLKTHEWFRKRERVTKLITAVALVLIIALGIYLRAVPYTLNGIEFYEFDSYIEYWQAKYIYEKGPLAWYTLTQQNPDTRIFWYPYGRDFIYTSYPLLPLWIGTTYHIVQGLGIGLKEWGILQPLIFAGIGIALGYVVGKELTGGKRLAGLLTSLLLAVLPAAIERTVIGYIEKEGTAVVPLFLFIIFYIKLLRSLSRESSQLRRALYAFLSGLFLSMIGWLWGGYVFILGTFAAYMLLAPLLLRRLDIHIVKYSAAVGLISMALSPISPSISKTLGIYPFSIKGLAYPLIAAMLAPLVYYYLAVGHKKLGLRKPLLSKTRYALLLTIGIIAIAVLVSTGYLPVSGRLAWALGLRFVPTDPLVESIAEHQSPISSAGMLMGMLRSWGVYSWIFFASPLVLGVIGSLYMIYRGDSETVYPAIGFLLAYYSYLNAAYMVATAAYFGIVVMSYTLSWFTSYLLPTEQEIEDRKKGRVRMAHRRPYRPVALLLLVLAFANLVYASWLDYQSTSNQIYTLRAGVSGLPYLSNSWYDAMKLVRSLPEGSVVVAWWDYGYGITVDGGKPSVADGSTWNGTQIGIIGLIMSSINTSDAAKLASLLRLSSNETYLMIIDGFIVSEVDNTTVDIWPVPTGTIPGIVDIPKSLWMIRIGNYTVNALRNAGANAEYVDTSQFLYYYSYYGQAAWISPNFINISGAPLIYKVLVDGMLYWAESQNKTGRFWWFQGNIVQLSSTQRDYLRKALGLDILYEIGISDVAYTSSRPLANDTYLRPYAVVAEPFIDARTGKPLTVSFTAGMKHVEGTIYSVIVFYKFTEIPLSA